MDKDPFQKIDSNASLEEVLALTKENNKLLKAMKRDALIGAVLKVLFWGILIGAAIYFSMTYIEPLLAPQGVLGEESQQEALRVLFELYNGQIPLP